MIIAVDYSRVPERQAEIHERLEAWARWVRVKPQAWMVQPMFRLYRSKPQWEMPELHEPINTLEAVDTEKQVARLPDKHRQAIRWCYHFKTNPLQAAKKIGVSREDLARLIDDGRDMLKNRLQSA